MPEENKNREEVNDTEEDLEDSEEEEKTEADDSEQSDDDSDEQENLDYWKTRAKKAEAKIVEKKKSEDKETQSESEEDSDEGLDYAKKAYLRAEGIEKEDFELVEEYVESTGKPIDKILENKVFQGELEDRREERKTKNATPSGTKRGGEAAQDNVDYWIQKDELPENTPENKELRRKVIAEKSKRDAQGGKSKFSDNPVA